MAVPADRLDRRFFPNPTSTSHQLQPPEIGHSLGQRTTVGVGQGIDRSASPTFPAMPITLKAIRPDPTRPDCPGVVMISFYGGYHYTPLVRRRLFLNQIIQGIPPL